MCIYNRAFSFFSACWCKTTSFTSTRSPLWQTCAQRIQKKPKLWSQGNFPETIQDSYIFYFLLTFVLYFKLGKQNRKWGPAEDIGWHSDEEKLPMLISIKEHYNG